MISATHASQGSKRQNRSRHCHDDARPEARGPCGRPGGGGDERGKAQPERIQPVQAQIERCRDKSGDGRQHDRSPCPFHRSGECGKRDAADSKDKASHHQETGEPQGCPHCRIALGRPSRADRPRKLDFICTGTGADHDIADHDLHLRGSAGRRRRRSPALGNQFRKHRQGRYALGHHQVPHPQLVAPIINLPTCRSVFAGDVGHPHPRDQAFCRDPRPLRFCSLPPTTRSLDHLQPGNRTIAGAVQMDAHFFASCQIPSP